MKVGLITYHIALNYGAVLQTYATCRLLKSLGHEVILIDLRLEMQKTILYPYTCLQQYRFAQFYKKFYPVFTKRYFSLQELKENPPIVDLLVVGSDQTWNPDISGKNAGAFFLDFGPDDIKRVSFASSFGISSVKEWDINKKTRLKNWLTRFNFISVRETSGIKICQNLGIQSVLALDPTLMFSEYAELTGQIEQTTQLTIFKFVGYPSFYSMAKQFSKKNGLKPKVLCKLLPVKGFRYVYPESIESWIRNIGKSACVFTDSFHGVVFSILLHRNFIAFVGNPDRISRIVDLLETIGLSDRLCYDHTDMELIDRLYRTPIDYREIDNQLNKLRINTLAFLNRALN